MTMKNKYVRRSRISEAKIREIVRYVAADLTALQAAALSGLNRNTVNRLYRGVRERMRLACEAQRRLFGVVEVDESFFGARRVKGRRGAAQAGAIVDQRDETFLPHIVAVTAGTDVDFPNSDETYHNVFSLSPVRSFDLRRYAAGRSRSVRFDQPGIVRVFCDIHSHMSAFILVFGHRFFAVTDEEGHYRIEGVPPGTYNVVVWHELFESASQPIEIPENGNDVELNFSLQGR